MIRAHASRSLKFLFCFVKFGCLLAFWVVCQNFGLFVRILVPLPENYNTLYEVNLVIQWNLVIVNSILSPKKFTNERLFTDRTYLQPHYSNGFFGNV